MISIPSNQLSEQGQTVTILRAQLAKAQIRIQSLEARLKWEDELFANPHLSPSHKLALRATVYTVGKAQSEPEALTKIYIPAIAEKIGLSAKTVGKNLQFLADTGALIREAETATDQNGQKITRVSIGLTEQTKRPGQITPPHPRNHGGYREHCPSCGGENLLEEKKTICTDCGTVISTTKRLINAEPADGQLDPRRQEEDPQAQDVATEQKTTLGDTQPTDNVTPLLKPKTPTDNLAAGEIEKPPTPPGGIPLHDTHDHHNNPDNDDDDEDPPDQREDIACTIPTPAILPMRTMKERPQPAEQEAERKMEEAARLLLDIAGDTASHISMPGENGKKYKTVHRPLTMADMRLHVQGKKTLGASLAYQDGTTRAQCFDADNPQAWQALTTAASLLIAEGYTPLLEPSPAGRGGHLWIIFTERVNASAAYTQVCKIAPGLKDVVEHWPGRGNQKVRLPAGKYVMPVFSQWCYLYDATGREIANSNLPNQQTPAGLIPARYTTEPETPPDHRRNHDKRPVTQSEHKGVDEYHRRKYGKHTMWVEWPDEQYLIDRFNSEYTIDELAVRERGGMINAGQIGRPERTASVAVTPDGQRFTDFGAGAGNPDGMQDGGDAFEFYIRSRNLDKKEVLRELGRALNKEASTEILRAARAGEALPAWVMEILTKKGREIYNANAQKYGHTTLEEHQAGG